MSILQYSVAIDRPLHFCSMAKAKAAEDKPLTAFGERLMHALREAGFTPTSLGRAAGFNSGYMTKLLYRPQERYEASKLETLCDLLGVRMHWLATGREPMREGGELSPVERAIVTARGYGVTEDVFWFVRGRDAREPERTEYEWLTAFMTENKKRVDDENYARAAKRVAMNEQRQQRRRGEVPPSEPRVKVTGTDGPKRRR